MKDIVIYVEGGGRKDQAVALRQAFRQFLGEWDDKAKTQGIRLTPTARGDRQRTWSDFQAALQRDPDKLNLLLVDAERPVKGLVWEHLRGGEDRWQTQQSDDDRYHLMAQTMEAWLVADAGNLASFYGEGFREPSVSATRDVEQIDKARLNSELQAATRGTSKGVYHKTRHAFDLLGRSDPAKVRARADHCDRFLKAIEAALQ